MFKIPIVSVSLSENLKKFINKLVSKNQYENKSKVIRDALLRLMSTVDAPNIDISSESVPISKSIIGNIILVTPNDPNIQKKINRIESDYKDEIVSKSQNFVSHSYIIFIIFEGKLQNFQKLVVELNSIEEIINFRYLIVN